MGVIILPLFLVIALGSSCSSYKRLTYMQNIAADADTLYQKKKETYRLQPSDILYVRVITNDENIDKLFNPLYLQGSGNMSQMRSENLYLMGFEVKDSGHIEMPILKKVYVKGLTLEEAQKTNMLLDAVYQSSDTQREAQL